MNEEINALAQIAFENALNNSQITGEKSKWSFETADGQEVSVTVEIN